VVENKSAEALAEKVRTGLHQARTCPAVEWAYDALNDLLDRIANYERYVEREIEPKLLARLAEAEKDAAQWESIAAERGTRMDEIQARAEAAEAERDRYKIVVEAAKEVYRVLHEAEGGGRDDIDFSALGTVLAALDPEQKPYRTKSGRVLTDAEIEALADEAERGYDIDHLLVDPEQP
jgi:hypothetical protein